MLSLMSLPKLVVALCVASLSRAQTYVIDDTNSTIQYTPGGRQVASGSSPSQWHIAQQPEVNITVSYDQTSTVGECNASQNCSMTIPFQGSGITIYVVQVNFAAINVSITVDGLSPAYRTYAEPKYYAHNFPLFDIQELPSGPHSINIALLDTTYGPGDRFAYPNGTSALVFDYAVVNELNVTGTSTPSTAAAAPTATPTQTSTQATSSASTTPIGAIVGGVVGGIALIMAAIVIYLCRHRIAASSFRRRRAEIDPEPSDVRRTIVQDHGPSPPTSAGYAQSSFDAARLYRPNSRTSFSTSQPPYPQSIAPGAGEMSEIGYAPSSSAYSSGKDRRGYGSGGGLTPATELAYQRFSGRSSLDSGGTGVPGQAPSVAPLGLRSGGVPSPSRSSMSQSVVSGALSEIPSINAARASQLTPEQLDFVHNLIGLNVPAADIAGVMERMREEGEEGEANRRMGLGVQRGVLGRGDVKTPPTNEELPDYEPPIRQ